jgi:hypothetical protein
MNLRHTSTILAPYFYTVEEMIKKIICALPFYKQEYRSMSQVNFKL